MALFGCRFVLIYHMWIGPLQRTVDLVSHPLCLLFYDFEIGITGAVKLRVEQVVIEHASGRIDDGAESVCIEAGKNVAYPSALRAIAGNEKEACFHDPAMLACFLGIGGTHHRAEGGLSVLADHLFPLLTHVFGENGSKCLAALRDGFRD